MRSRYWKQKVTRLTAAALIATMSVSPMISWAAPEELTVEDVLEIVEEDEKVDFELLRSKWKRLLVGGGLDVSNKLVADYAASVDSAAEKLWNDMIKLGESETDERTCLFSDLPLTDKKTRTGSSQITLTFDRLKAIVLAYETEGSKYYKDPEVKREMIAALDLMIAKHYSVYYACVGTGTGIGSGNHSFGNWYDWRIGTPRQLCDLLLMFYDELTEEQIARYVEPVMANNKKVDTTGANKTWIANVFIQSGILLGDGSLVEAGKAGVKDVFRYVASGDGFHKDGSFIQHNYYAYSGGYGKALLCTIAPMMNVLHDTPYELSYEDGREQILFDMIFEAYEPLIYGGRFMDMAREREISRVANQDSIPGRQAIRSIIMLLDVLPEDQKARAESMVKEWLSDEEVLAQVCIDPIGGYNEYYLPAGIMAKAIEIADSDITPRGSLIRHKRYGAMDRVVHLRDNFGFTVSMSSNRIRNTEGTNDEGLRLWNIGDGLTYLYNSDKSYYSDHYWATVDYHRLPGTTVNRVESRAPKAGYATANKYKFAGGTDLGEFGIAGMEMQGVGTTSRNGAHAKKSWFMFDDEVVAVGSDIDSSLDGSGVETIVENRKVKPDWSNTLTVDGAVQAVAGGSDDFNGLHPDTKWIHLAGTTEDSDVGYYFPGGADITGIRETRNGSWDLVNTYAKFTDNEPRTNSFVTFWFDHGIKPTKAAYSYVILPGKDAAETAAYNETPDVEILRQDESIHAVRENTLGITGINFFTPGKYGAFSTKVPQSVMYRLDKEEGIAEISFADPTQTQTELSLTAALPILEIVEKSDEIQVSEKNGETVFTAVLEQSPADAAGKSFMVKVKLAENDNMFESCEPGTTPEHWSVESGNAVIVEEADQNHALEISSNDSKQACASTELVYPGDENGSMIGLMVKGNGVIRLIAEEDQTFDLKFGRNAESDQAGEIKLEDDDWHQIKMRVNTDNGTLRLMLDGVNYGEPIPYEKGQPKRLAVLAQAGEKVSIDNLFIKEFSTEAPTRPMGLTYTEYGDNYVNLKWDASESENPFDYVVYVDGTPLEEKTTETTYLVTGLEPEETYIFEVQAVDDNEIASEMSEELEVVLLERQNNKYIINFDEYESGTNAQYGWTYAGKDEKGIVEIRENPSAKDPFEDNLMTDVEYWEKVNADVEVALAQIEEGATPSNAMRKFVASYRKAKKRAEATPSNAAKKKASAAAVKASAVSATATASNAAKDGIDRAETEGSLKAASFKAAVSKATASNAARSVSGADQVLYVYSGTAKSGTDRNASYSFDPQTKEQTYYLKLYFDECTKFSNFALLGSDGKQAVTMMISDYGKIGYRAGDAPSKTVELLNEVVEGEWIEFAITANPETQKFTISANGTEKKNLPFRNETKDIAKITFNAPGNAIGGFYVDDIVIPANNDYQKWTLTELAEELEEELVVPFGTDFYDLELPESIEVTAKLPDGEETTEEIRVNWEKGDYDSTKSGTYTLYGSLACPANCINKVSDRKIKIKVEVEKEIKYYSVILQQTAGGTISADEEEAEEGSQITVTAEPDEGYRLAYWIIDGTQKPASGNSYTFRLNDNVTVSASFEAKPVEPEVTYYTVKISPDLANGKVLTSTGYAKEGTEVVLTVVPDQGYQLKSLLMNGRKVEPETDLTYRFILKKNTEITAVFEKTDSDDDEKNENGSNGGSSGGHDRGSSSGRQNAGIQRPSYAVDGSWRVDQDRWYFTSASGKVMTGEWACTLCGGNYEWFYFGADSVMVTGWQVIDGTTYYFQEVSDGRRGRMLTGWQQIQGVWYYFNPVSDGTKGAMLKNTVTPDGYQVGADGAWIS